MLILPQYRPTSLLSVISKRSETIINKKVVEPLKEQAVRLSIGQVLSTITHGISEALENKNNSRTIALDISKAFDKVCHKGILLKLSRYGITGRVYSIIMSFIPGRYLKVVNGQSPGALGTNAGVPPEDTSRTIVP